VIFRHPTSGTIPWEREVEPLLRALGADVDPSAEGSRVYVLLNEEEAVFHRPHPRKEADPGAIRALRRLLVQAGVHL